MSEPAPAQVEAPPVPQDSATSVAAEPAAEGGAEGQSKKGAKKVRARSVNLEALIVTRGIGARSRAARAPRGPAISPRDSSRSRRVSVRRVPALARTPHSCARARPPARRRSPRDRDEKVPAPSHLRGLTRTTRTPSLTSHVPPTRHPKHRPPRRLRRLRSRLRRPPRSPRASSPSKADPTTSRTSTATRPSSNPRLALERSGRTSRNSTRRRRSTRPSCSAGACTTSAARASPPSSSSASRRRPSRLRFSVSFFLFIHSFYHTYVQFN